MRSVLIGLVLAAATVSCASSPKPSSELAEAKAAVRGASEIGAASEPQAALHLKLATDQIANAERHMADGDNEAARRLLQRARADAELALILTRSAQRNAQARVALRRVNELERSQP
jgi:hypothetical protein